MFRAARRLLARLFQLFVRWFQKTILRRPQVPRRLERPRRPSMLPQPVPPRLIESGPAVRSPARVDYALALADLRRESESLLRADDVSSSHSQPVRHARLDRVENLTLSAAGAASQHLWRESVPSALAETVARQRDLRRAVTILADERSRRLLREPLAQPPADDTDVPDVPPEELFSLLSRTDPHAREFVAEARNLYDNQRQRIAASPRADAIARKLNLLYVRRLEGYLAAAKG